MLLPKEHGSWSLALEPIALGLLVAPSVAGGWLAVASIAGFFSRRPLKLLWRDPRPERRATARGAFAMLSVLAGAGAFAALAFAGPGLALWLAPAAVAGAAFLWFDLRNEMRAGAAEIAGATAFAFVPGAMAAAAGWPVWPAVALSAAILGRAVPTVLTVRSYLRAAKTAEASIVPALAASGLAVVVAAMFVDYRTMPLAVVIALGVLLVRSVVLLCAAPKFRARTLGFFELAVGAGFVLTTALAWRFFGKA
ncbi:MAG TPA: YwiC-like family protein [Opitutaceae bacterium]|nr:YwiC-like family protein [Opitutaceae bacterium]